MVGFRSWNREFSSRFKPLRMENVDHSYEIILIPILTLGSRPEQLNKHVRQELSEYLEPSTMKTAPILPNCFTEGKGPEANTSVGRRQACYDGALGERGMLRFEAYANGGKAQYRIAHTITSTYHSDTGDLTIYSTHATQSSDSQHPIEYHMRQLNGWKLTGNADHFRQGVGALRNARDWAKEKRDEVIAAANRVALDPNTAGIDDESSSHSLVSMR